MSHCNAHRMWTKATYFADRARTVGIADRMALEADIEAAIVFGRSSLDHLQRQYARTSGFRVFYEQAVNGLKNDALCAPLLELRSFVVHEGSAPMRKVISVSVEVQALVMVEVVDVQIVRGDPWYRRSPTILWQDFRAAIWRWKKRRRKPPSRPNVEPPSTAITSESLHFMDPPAGSRRQGNTPTGLPNVFKEMPALDAIDHWLNKVERIVLDAESQFGIL
jgi:hypothetical protein